MRVALVSPVGDIGGGERVLMEIARGLSDRGYTNRTFCLREGTWTKGGWRGEDSAITAYARGYRLRNPWSVWSACTWLRRELENFRPDIIHANHGSWWIAERASRRLQASTVWHLHDFPGHFDPQTQLGLLHKPTATIFTTQHVASGFPQLVGRVHEIIPPVTIEPEAYREAEEDDTILTTHGLRAFQYFLTVSRWQSHKGLHTLLAAAQSLMSKGALTSDIKFVVVGRPANDQEHKYQHQCQQQIDEAGIGHQIVRIDGCEDAALRSLYKNAISLVHPASSEGFGLVLLEAMAMGTPVIACDAFGPAEILENGAYGLLVSVQSHQALAKEMELVANDLSLRSSLSAKSLTRSKQFTKGEMVRQTLQFYQRIITSAHLKSIRRTRTQT